MRTSILATAAVAALALAGPAMADDEYCREYTRTIYVGGMQKQGYGTACLQPDGSWQIVAENTYSNNDYYAPPVVMAPVYRQTYVVREPVYYRRSKPTVIAFNFNSRNQRHDHWDRDRWDRHDNRHGGRHH